MFGALAEPLTVDDFEPVSEVQAALGQLLFYDKILSGNRNISCGTCHHPDLGGADGLSLGIGEGGVGLGPDRLAGFGAERIERRVPRNAPALWNLGARQMHTLMHDGRISIADTYENGFNTPAEEWLPEGLDSLLAAQALFPLTSETEMAGRAGENEVAGAVNERIDYGWPILAKRVRTIPEYGERFVEAFDHISAPEEVDIVDIANAIGAFITLEFQSFDSPYDRFLAGDANALTPEQEQGRRLFFGEAGCAACHSGPLLSDQRFHALGLPPFGPGRIRRFDPIPRDVGRMGESDLLEDAYKFRTPSLRNVALTAPYGHNGAYRTLAGIIQHHLDPQGMFRQWAPEDAQLPEAPWLTEVDFAIWRDSREIARQVAAMRGISATLTEADIESLTQFLHALTGDGVDQLRFGVPETVPSGLPVD